MAEVGSRVAVQLQVLVSEGRTFGEVGVPEDDIFPFDVQAPVFHFPEGVDVALRSAER